MGGWGVVVEYAWRKSRMVGATSCDGSTSGHAGINVELYQSPTVLVYYESAISGREEMVK